MNKTKEDALKQLKKNVKSFYEFEDRFKDDKDIVEYAIKNGASLVSASVRWRNDLSMNILDAQHKAPGQINIERAIFLSKVNIELRDTFSQYYNDSNEFLIETKLHYGKEYSCPNKRYNRLSTKKLKEELKIERKKQLDKAKQAYMEWGEEKPIESGFIQVDENWKPPYRDHRSLMYFGEELRRMNRPFSDIIDFFEAPIKKEKESIVEYMLKYKIRGSFPERVMDAFLSLQGIDFVREKYFTWSRNIDPSESAKGSKRYDFFIPHWNAIIEVHGAQHYEGGFSALGGRTLEEEMENDKLKEELARQNGIEHYIVIDASVSSFAFIRNSILKNKELLSLLPSKEVDWDIIIDEAYKKNEADVTRDYPLFIERERQAEEWISVIKDYLVESDYFPVKKVSRPNTPEFNENIKSVVPSRRGLLPYHLAVLRELDGERYKCDEKHLHDVCYYNYGLAETDECIDELINRGFVRSGDVFVTLKNTTVPNIKRVLKEYGLPTKGKKAELISLITNSLSKEELERVFPDRYYSLTDLGKEELKDNPYIYLEGYFRLSIWQLNRINNEKKCETIYSELLDWSKDMFPSSDLVDMSLYHESVEFWRSNLIDKQKEYEEEHKK